MNAKEFYESLKNSMGFTKLTSTGINTDYEKVFEFAELYFSRKAKEKYTLKQIKDLQEIVSFVEEIIEDETKVYSEISSMCTNEKCNWLDLEEGECTWTAVVGTCKDYVSDKK
jgi:hypothetical protein